MNRGSVSCVTHSVINPASANYGSVFFRFRCGWCRFPTAPSSFESNLCRSRRAVFLICCQTEIVARWVCHTTQLILAPSDCWSSQFFNDAPRYYHDYDSRFFRQNYIEHWKVYPRYKQWWGQLPHSSFTPFLNLRLMTGPCFVRCCISSFSEFLWKCSFVWGLKLSVYYRTTEILERGWIFEANFDIFT